jgi:hypothetical protein
MTRAELEHIIRAAATIADVDDLIVIGSQSVLGELPTPHRSCCCRPKLMSTRSRTPNA